MELPNVPQTVAEKFKTSHTYGSGVFCKFRESENSEPRTRFECDIELTIEPPNQLMPQDVSGAILLNIYRLDSQINLKQNRTRLLVSIFESFNERDLILQNGRELKGSGVLFVKTPLADCIKKREAVKELDAGEKDLKTENFQVLRL